MTQSATILLVEDDLALLEGIADLLEIGDLGYDVHVMMATDGLAALTLLEQQVPDLIITDIMMPRLDGFGLLERVRTRLDWVHIPVIILTARGRKEDILKGRLSGAELYITKPFESDDLMQLVRGQLDRAFQLQKDRQMQYDLLARNIIQMLNHELRTPLTYVTAYYEMLAEGLLTDDGAFLKEYLHGIQVGAARLGTLVEDLLEVVALRSGETAARFKRRAGRLDNLATLIEAWCQQRRADLAGRSVSLEWELPASLPAVYGEAEALKEILDRLLDNAVKFSQPGQRPPPTVTVSAAGSNEQVYFRVKDNGLGFPNHLRERVFDLFYQHQREMMEQQGAGSGLAIVKGLVDLHHGRVVAESEPGRGSTFTVWLPAVGAEPLLGDAGIPAGGVKQQVSILLVEDETNLQVGVKELLELFDDQYDIQVMTAANGRDGLEVMARHKPDLIISDIKMPEMDGYEFLARVRRNPAWVHIPFIFFTARGSREDIVRGRRSGAEEYITKPFDPQELFELVIAKLDRHFQRQDVLRQSFDDLKRGILDLLLPDFRLPIRAVASQSSHLAVHLEQAENEADLAVYLKGIQAGSEEVRRFVEDFISLVELRTGETAAAYEMRAHPMDSHLLFRQLVAIWQDRLRDVQLDLEVDLADDMPAVYVDAETVGLAFKRLLSFILAMLRQQPCSVLVCRSYRGDREAQLEVTLPKECISQETLERCQTLLSTQETTMIGATFGDLGLMIAKGVIEVHGGRLSVSADAESGCRFLVSLPVYQPVVDTVE